MERFKSGIIGGLVVSSILCLYEAYRSRSELDRLRQDCKNEFDAQDDVNRQNLDLFKAHDKELRAILEILKVRNDSK